MKVLIAFTVLAKLSGFIELITLGDLKCGKTSLASRYWVLPGNKKLGYWVVKLNAWILYLDSKALYNSVLNWAIPPLKGGKTDKKAILNSDLFN